MDEIIRSIETLFSPKDLIELRAITGNGIASGYYTDHQALARAAAELDRNPDVSGIYVTLNSVEPALLARRANRMKYRLSRKDATTADTDIHRRHYLPVDIDPRRPSGVSSTDTEHTAALHLAGEITAYLSSLGWPEPIRADSGNGAHLLYRIDLPNDTSSRDLVRSCLSHLDLLFSNERCLVDAGNFNAGRIWKLYGTLSRKGDNTPDHPHRRSHLITVPAEQKVVPFSLLTAFAADIPRDPGPEPGLRPFILKDWLISHGFTFQEKPYQGGTLFRFDQCPFSDEHQDGAYAIQFASGGIFAGCHHTSCGGGRQRWPELKDRYERQERYRKMKRDQAKRRAAIPEDPVSGPEDEHTGRKIFPYPEDIRQEAKAIVQTADPVKFMLDTFSLDHTGDLSVAKCCLMSLGSRLVLNSNGLHISISGESGKGKSHTIATMLRLVPERFRVASQMSDKALLYMKGIVPGSVIALDDMNLSDQIQELLKGVTTSFKEPFVYQTVNKDRNGQVCTIPERCVWWVVKVEGAGDSQVWNRMLTCWIDESVEQDRRVLEKTLEEAALPPEAIPTERREFRVCHAVWEELEPLWVVIPFSRRIRFQNAQNRRNTEMLLDLIRTRAVMMQKQRKRVEGAALPCIEAEEEDFIWALGLYEELDDLSGAQSSKLTRKEYDLIQAIRTIPSGEFTASDLQRVTGLSHSVVYKLIHGYNCKGKNYSGLLEKCPALSYLDRTRLTDGQEGSVWRKCVAYQWDPWIYSTWSIAGTCKLDDPGEHHDPDDPDERRQGGSWRHDAAVCRLLESDDNASVSKNNNNNLYLEERGGKGGSQKEEGSGERVLLLSPQMPPPASDDLNPGIKAQNGDQSMQSRTFQGGSFPPHAATPPQVSLPGTLLIPSFVPWTADIGRCHLCNQRRAAWFDPGSGIALCRECYDRERIRSPGVR